MKQEDKEQKCKKCGRVFGSVKCFDVDCPHNTPKITMTKEEKDKLIKTLNQMIERSNKSISIWTRLMEQGKYPTEDCLKHININKQQKEACLKIIKEYETSI